jgi:hypothetical protein
MSAIPPEVTQQAMQEATSEGTTASQSAACGTTSCEDYYRRLHNRCGEVLDASFANDTSGLQAESHGFIKDLEEWIKVLTGRPEKEMLTAALREYQLALLSLVHGQYRQAFMSLRLALELLLGGIHFSGSELELRIWLKGNRDIVWGSIINIDDGVLSKKFTGTFFEALADEAPHYRLMAESVYRECSEYVHGNAATHSGLPETVSFSKTAFESWHQKARSVRLVALFTLCTRYFLFLDTTNRNLLEAQLLDNLGHLAEVRVAFGAPVEPDTNG